MSNLVTPGNFNALNLPSLDREMLDLGYQAISSVEGGWDFLKTYEPPIYEGFMFISNPPSKLKQIEEAILEKYGGHSGASYGYTLRNLQYIAQVGWDAYSKVILDKYGPAASKKAFPYPCPCHLAQGKEGWCGVAGFGVPACEH